MAALTGLYISQSYGGVIHLSTNTGIATGSSTQLQDGFGTNLGVYFNGLGNVSASTFTGVASSATSATSASYANVATSASYSLTATSASYSNNSTTASYALNATSASYAPFTPTPTGSFATTGSNTFVGNQIISGSVSNAVRALTISSNTASIDLSVGNLFTLVLVNTTNTHISASNLQKGQTVSLQVTNGSLGNATVTFNSVFTFPSGSSYIPFASSSAVDSISFISYDGNKLRGVAQNNFI